ncbi:unnamed protein product [Closterium sp. NIES-64]|nr:unnamed protein product [Closterium sp. NIES-64]
MGFNYGSSSRLPLLAAASAGDAGAGGDGDGGHKVGTGEREELIGDLEAVGELEGSGTIGEEQEEQEEQTKEQASAGVPSLASDQPNQWLTAHLDLSEVKRQLQRSNERTAENLKHLRNRLNASNEWTLSHLKKGHQWTSEHLRESNQRTREQLQHLIHSEQLLHLEERLDVRALKARLNASNAKTRAQLRHLGVNLEHLEGHLDVGALKARPVGTELLQELDCAELDCAVIGQIPQGLRGRFIRNGPNPQLPPSSPDLYHWFDGDGMVHSVNFHPPGENSHSHPREAREENFHSPQVSYGRRYIRTTGWQEERAAGRALFGGLQQVGLGASHLLLAAMNLLGLRQQDAPMWNMTKNVSNNHFIQHAGRLLSLWEAGLPYSLDSSTLDTKGVHSFDDTWRSGMTAHPKVDPVTNHMMIYGYNLTHKPYLRYGVVDPSGSLIHATDLDLPHPVMMHDFAITQHHSIFLDFPLRFQLDKVIQSHGKAKPFVFDPSKPSRIGVLPRFGSNPDMRWFTVDAGVLQTLGLAELADELACDEVARLHEYRLDLQSGAVEERSLCKVCVVCVLRLPFHQSQLTLNSLPPPLIRCPFHCLPPFAFPPFSNVPFSLSPPAQVCCDFPSINPNFLSLTPSPSPFCLPHFAFPVLPLIPSFSPPAQVCCDFPSINPNFLSLTPSPSPFCLPHFAFPVLPLIPSFSPPAQVCCDFPSINPNFLSLTPSPSPFCLPRFAFPVLPLLPSFSPPAQVCCDFPSINPNFTGRPHRFAYSARFTAQPGPGEGEACRGMDLRDVEGWRWVGREGDGGQGGGLVDSSPIGSPYSARFTAQPGPGERFRGMLVGGRDAGGWAGMQVGGQGCRSVGRDAGGWAGMLVGGHGWVSSSPDEVRCSNSTTVPSFNAIMKHDLAQGTYQSSSRSQSGETRSDEVGMGRDMVGLGADAVGMGAEEEDDGWVLAHVWDEEEMRSEVIVLDAMNLDKQPLARVILPKRVPYGFHGTFLPD